jgi:hypothetical protein
MRSEFLRAQGILQNRVESKPLREAFLLRGEMGKVLRSGRPNGVGASALTIAILAAASGMSTACSGENTTNIPSYSSGTEGNAINFDKPPVAVPPKDAGPLVVDLSCFDAGTAPACNVHFSDIFAKMKGSSGVWQCAAAGSCHGNGSQKPVLNDNDIATSYSNLTNYVISGSGPYVRPCVFDPTQSSILCNLGSGIPCGSGMPLIGLNAAVALTDADRTMIQNWLTCGAPNN